MSRKNDSLALLPNGFVDLLPPYAEVEAKSIQTLMEKFSSFGYRRIKPPLLEFEDSLLAPGPGERLASETFRLMDPVSHRMLGIRSDITAQVSRIVSSRLGNEQRPLRLTYANDVLRTRGGQMRTERQFAQVGCELIGDANGIETDVEVCILSLLGLKALGIENVTLDLTIPGFVSHLLSNVDDEEAKTTKKAVGQRDIDTLQAQKNKSARIIAQAMSASGCFQTALAVLGEIKCDKFLRQNIKRLKQICEGVEAAVEDLKIGGVSLTVDVLEQDGFEYHEGFGFTLFSSDVRGELGRGGCYNVHFGKNEMNEVAKGFTLYMDTISKFAPGISENDRVFVGHDQSWSVIADLQEQGWTTVRGVGKNDTPTGCTHVYSNGKIMELA